MSSPDSTTIVATSAHIDEFVLRRCLRKMSRGEVCYLFPEPPELETTWHGYIQKVATGRAARKRQFAIQGHPEAAVPHQRYREVGLDAAVGFAMKIKPRALIVA